MTTAGTGIGQPDAPVDEDWLPSGRTRVSAKLCVGLTSGVLLAGATWAQTRAPGITPDAERSSMVAPDTLPVDPSRPPTSLDFGVRARAMFTDNGALQSRDSRRSDTITEINPYVIGTANRPDARGTVSYGVRAFNAQNDTIRDTVNQELRAFGDVSLGSDRLWLSGRALVTDVNASPFAATSADPATTPDANRVRYKQFEVAPYFLGRIDNFADYQLRYRAGYFDTGLPGLKTTDQSLLGTATSNRDFGRIGWQASAETSQRRYDNGFDYGSSSVILSALFAQSPEFRAGLSAKYSHVDIVVDSSGRNSGVGPGLIARWTPSERTLMHAVAAREYFGNTGQLRFSHRAESWTFALNAQRTLVSPLETSVLFLDPSQQFGSSSRSTSNSVVDGLMRQGLLNPAGALFSTGLSNAAIALETGVNASVGLVGTRNAFVITLLSSRRSPVQLSPEAIAGLPQFTTGASIDTTGGVASYSRFLSPTSSLILRLSHTSWRNDAATAASRLSSAAVGYYTRWSQRFGGYLELRRSQQRSSGSATAGYDENALIAGIDFRF
mgnify:CR=1 FL=1